MLTFLINVENRPLKHFFNLDSLTNDVSYSKVLNKLSKVDNLENIKNSVDKTISKFYQHNVNNKILF